MDQKSVPSKHRGVWNSVDPDDVQDRLADESYVRHDHGGYEHGRDWDDWLKADRVLKLKGNKRKRGCPKS